MQGGSALSDEERRKIEEMRLASTKIGELAIAINRHRNARSQIF